MTDLLDTNELPRLPEPPNVVPPVDERWRERLHFVSAIQRVFTDESLAVTAATGVRPSPINVPNSMGDESAPADGSTPANPSEGFASPLVPTYNRTQR